MFLNLWYFWENRNKDINHHSIGVFSSFYRIICRGLFIGRHLWEGVEKQAVNTPAKQQWQSIISFAPVGQEPSQPAEDVTIYRFLFHTMFFFNIVKFPRGWMTRQPTRKLDDVKYVSQATSPISPTRFIFLHVLIPSRQFVIVSLQTQ